MTRTSSHLHNAARALSSRSRCFQFSSNLNKDFFSYRGWISSALDDVYPVMELSPRLGLGNNERKTLFVEMHVKWSVTSTGYTLSTRN